MGEIFRRVEKKYIITQAEFDYIQKAMKNQMIEDSHGKSKICNIYFDTQNYDLISYSIQKPIYKDKVRLRSYNIPTQEDPVYLEIKRKYEGVVSKRRVEFKLNEAKDYFEGEEIETTGTQIQNEIDYYFNYYNLQPTMYLSYDRVAYYGKDDDNFRITFDTNIIARDYDLSLDKGSYGISIFEKNKYIMEVKTLGAIPLWFVEVLSKKNIFPNTFSKYGEAYKQIVLNDTYAKNYAV